MSSIAMLIGRVLLSIIFIQAGISKLMDVSARSAISRPRPAVGLAR